MDKQRIGFVILVAVGLLVYWIYKDTRRSSTPAVVPRSESAGEEGETAGTRPEQADHQQGPFLYAEVSRSATPLPRRYQASLPATVEELKGDWSKFPPRAYVEDLLCQGDPGMLERLLGALRGAAAGTKEPEALEDFGSLFGYCSSPELCAFARGVVEGGEPPAVKRVYWSALVRCGGPEIDALFERPEAPAVAVAEHFGKAPFVTADRDRLRGYSPGLVRALGELVDAPDAPALRTDALALRTGAFALAESRDPRAVGALLALHARTKDANVRNDLAVAMGRLSDPRAQTIFKKACAGQDDRRDPACRLDAVARSSGAKGVDELVREYEWKDIQAFLKEKPRERPKVLVALERCLAGEPLANSREVRYQQHGCLEHLALLDRPRAVGWARKLLDQGDIQEGLVDLAGTLDRYPEAGVLEARLTELGLLEKKEGKKDRQVAEEAPGLTARDILAAGGRTHWFDVETSQFPNEHDHLLRELAKLVKPELDRAVFEEIPPRETEDGREIGGYRLIAYLDGQKVSVAAENLGDWYDVSAALGLLNTLLKERRSEQRLVTLPTGDQTAIILAGPQQGIRQAAQEGLIRIEGADAGMDAGKAFEDQVLKKLEADGEIILKGSER